MSSKNKVRTSAHDVNNLTQVLHKQEALWWGQQDGHFSADRMRTLTISHTKYTKGHIAKWNVVDQVRNNIASLPLVEITKYKPW